MATTRSVDLANIVLILGNFVGTPGILQLSENSRYEFTPSEDDECPRAKWKGDQSEELRAPYLCLTFGEHLFSPQGWVLGSSDDTDRCDLQVAEDNKTGISRQHLRIDISPDRHCPRLNVLSTNSVRIHNAERTVTLSQGQHLEISRVVTIDLGASSMQAWRPILSREEAIRYREKAEKFSQDFMDALPKRLPICLDTTGAPTFDLRFGRNNAVYRREETGSISAGSFGSVMMVREVRSGNIFAAKVPHFKASDPASKVRNRWEALAGEYEKIVKLKHPCIVEAIDVLVGRNGAEPPWLIMEWIPDDLGSIDLDQRHVPALLTQVSDGLAFMHGHNFAHRDLKPENILVQQQYGQALIAKIADFGVTKYDVSGNMETFTGTSLYMAPEVWERKRAYTNAVDIWSLGIIAAPYLTSWDPRSDMTLVSKPPSTSSEHEHWIRSVIFAHVADAPDKSRPLLEGLLCERPENRWTASECLEWLRVNAEACIGIHKGHSTSSSSMKRPASASSEIAENPDGGIFARSNNPTLSTTRARGSLLSTALDASDNPSDTASTLPDTASWGSIGSQTAA